MDSSSGIPLARVGKIDGCIRARDNKISVDHVANFRRQFQERECFVGVSDDLVFAEDFSTLVHVVAFSLDQSSLLVIVVLWFLDFVTYRPGTK